VNSRATILSSGNPMELDMRRCLDVIYRIAGYVAAISLVAIFALVSVQVSARLLDGGMRLVGLTPLGFIVPSIAEICGFLLATASFLALAYTLTVGGHIRVGMLVERLPAAARRVVEGVTGLLAAFLASYAAVAMARLALKSWNFNDVSFGFVAVPLWLPQAGMALGLALLAIALCDVTWTAWRTRTFLESGSEA
jgi:TRAP-type C4-dicarboxylate transport system permease small subunit